ncbi:MAG TPA: alanine dehydrogenase [Egibacteraceae bacterium]|nr:alanine dehydrogenase [Egibacteraceae bacterium]
MSTIGLPAEVKDGERRVALDPVAIAAAVRAGHTVRVQSNAGTGAGFPDADYKEAGAEIVNDPGEAWAADLVVKVKEPQADEYGFFHPDLTLFTFLHLAAAPDLADALVASGVTAYAYETLTQRGELPLLAPMSEIAGRTAAIVGAHFLSAREGGSGTLLGGAAGVPPARVVVIGLGVAGTMAARGARGLDAEVTGVDVDLGRLHAAQAEGIVTATLASSQAAVGELVAHADLVVGAALVPGARAPVVVTEQHVAGMGPGSVVVDLAIDQGGCIATARPTTLSDPVYESHGVLHYCVTNVPGQYPRTASRALSAAVAPRLLRLLADPEHPSLQGALNVARGEIVHPAVAEGVAAAKSAA